MRFAIIAYIALGLVLSLVVGIEYKCEGQEMFPAYYGSPFVFKQKSLGSSMEYYYSISGLMLNILVWSLVLYFMDMAMRTLICKINKKKIIEVPYKIIIGFVVFFSTFNILADSTLIGQGFSEDLNYWYWNVSKRAKEWGVDCKPEFIVFRE